MDVMGNKLSSIRPWNSFCFEYRAIINESQSLKTKIPRIDVGFLRICFIKLWISREAALRYLTFLDRSFLVSRYLGGKLARDIYGT